MGLRNLLDDFGAKLRRFTLESLVDEEYLAGGNSLEIVLVFYSTRIKL